MGDFLREPLEAAENLSLGAFGSVCEPSSGSLWAPLGTSARLPLGLREPLRAFLLGASGSIPLRGPYGSLWERLGTFLWGSLGAYGNLFWAPSLWERSSKSH